MRNIICIHQPDFLPYLGFFERLFHCDTFVVLDNVQFLRRGWHHRDQIKTVHGVQWLTVPVQKKGRYEQLINAAQIDQATNWKHKHLMMISTNYRKAWHFDRYFEALQHIYQQPLTSLMEFNLALLRWIIGILDCQVRIVFASSLPVTSTKTLRLVEIVEALHGTAYLSGVGARAYLNEHLFQERHIPLLWQNFQHPVYPQLHGDFVPNLSVVDCLLNCGAACRELLQHEVIP